VDQEEKQRRFRARAPDDQDALTPEQVVGRRITRARKDRGISRQEDLGARLAEYLGKPWTKQAVSETERGNRRLNPTELLAFATVLRYPVSWFFLPPTARLKFPGRVVLVGELSDGALRAAADEDIRQLLQNEQMVVLYALERAYNEANERMLGLLELTEKKEQQS
jgi:transcriptional regulator with XRE-family HTH domain